VNEKRLICRVRYYLRFWASAVGLGTYQPWIRGDYCIGMQDQVQMHCKFIALFIYLSVVYILI
jgi:hypothetical protein